MGQGRRMTTGEYNLAFQLCCLESYLKSLFINMGLSVKEAEEKIENAVSEGEKCAACGWRPGDKPTEAQLGFPENLQEIQLNHRDENPNNNNPSNLNLLCKSCNLRGVGNVMVDVTKAAVDGRPKGSGGPAPSLRGVDSVCVSKKEIMREDEEARMREAERVEVYKDGPSVMKVNIRAEREWLALMYREIGDKGSIPKVRALNEFARLVQINPETTRKYLLKYATSGPFMVIESEGVSSIVFRNQYLPLEEVRD
jgi:hypothetical protein